MPVLEPPEIEQELTDPLIPCPRCGEEYETESGAEECCPTFECPECGTDWPDQDEAHECCRIRCQYCDESHEDEEDALRCCQTMCRDCGQYHHDADDARTCCGGGGGDPYYPTLPPLTEPYQLAIENRSDRPARLFSIEQEVTKGGAAIAKMLYDHDLSDQPDILSYSHEPYQGEIAVCEDSTVPHGGEVKYSKFDLSRTDPMNLLSMAVGRIRQLHKDAGVVDVGTAAGLHIHVAAKDHAGQVIEPLHMAAYHELCSFGEDTFFGMAAAGWRRHRHEDGSNFASPIPKLRRAEKSPWRVSKVMGAKYNAVNFTRLLETVGNCRCGSVKYGAWSECECGAFDGATIEWRVFNTSTMPETIHAWLLLVAGVTAQARTHPVGTLPDSPFVISEARTPNRMRARRETLKWFLKEGPYSDDERDVIWAAAERSPLMKDGG